MKDLYFTRHGQTVWNVENKICGATDIALTENGHKQAEELGMNIMKELKSGRIYIDEILSSPLQRAFDTAKHISDATGLELSVDMRLTEQNFGKYESTPRNGAEFHEAKKEFISHYGTGESMLGMAQRIYNLLDDIKRDDKIYLLVAHNGIARFVQSYFEDMTNEEFSAFGIKNCELKHYKI